MIDGRMAPEDLATDAAEGEVEGCDAGEARIVVVVKSTERSVRARGGGRWARVWRGCREGLSAEEAEAGEGASAGY